MKSGKWKLGTVAAMAVAVATFLSQAHASPTVTLSFAPPTITTAGDAVGVDVIVTGAPSAAGGVSFFLDYGNLAFVSYTLGPGGTLGPAPFDLSLGDLGGTVDIFGFADLSVATDAALYALQNSGGPFTIVHFDFTGVAPGAFTLGLRLMSLSNFEGTALLCGPNNCTTAIPEPATALLVAIGLGALALRRRERLVV